MYPKKVDPRRELPASIRKKAAELIRELRALEVKALTPVENRRVIRAHGYYYARNTLRFYRANGIPCDA